MKESTTRFIYRIRVLLVLVLAVILAVLVYPCMVIVDLIRAHFRGAIKMGRTVAVEVRNDVLDFMLVLGVMIAAFRAGKPIDL